MHLAHVFAAGARCYAAFMERRRSRMRRIPTGKRLALGPRDIAIFKVLGRYRYLRSTYLHAFVGGASATRFKERLGDLYHEGGYLDRPSQQWAFADARCSPVVYERAPDAVRALKAIGDASDEERTFLSDAAHRQFLHSLLICEALASIELGTWESPLLRFIAWPEILARAPEATRASLTPWRIPLPSGGYLVPDGLFGLEYIQSGKNAYRFFALEADRGTMPVLRSNALQTSVLGKIAAYREIAMRQVQRSYLGLPNLLVLLLTTSEGRLSNIVISSKSKTNATRASCSKPFRLAARRHR